MSGADQPRLFTSEGDQLLLDEDELSSDNVEDDRLADEDANSERPAPDMAGVRRWFDESAVRPRLPAEQARILDAYREARPDQLPGINTSPTDIGDFGEAIDGALVPRESWQVDDEYCDDEWASYAIRHNRHLRLEACETCPLWDADQCRAAPDEPTEIAGWAREHVWVPGHCPHGSHSEFQSRSEAVAHLLGQYMIGWGGRASRGRVVEAIHYRALSRGVDLSFAELQSVFVEALASSDGKWQFQGVFRAGTADERERRASLARADATVDSIGSADHSGTGLNETRLRHMLLADLQHHDVPTPEEELVLMERVQAGDNAAFEEMWIRNVRLAFDRAKRRSNIAGSEFLDRLSSGMLALKRAIEKFDPDLGYKFSTYATPWIKQYISRQFENEARLVRLPVHVGQDVYGEVVRANMGIGDFEDVVDRLMDACSNDRDEARQIAHFAMDDAIRIGDFSEFDALREVVGDPDELDNQVDRRMLVDAIGDVLNSLRERERIVIERRFGLRGNLPQTLEEVGADLGVTRERIRQIESKVLKFLKESVVLQRALDEDHLSARPAGDTVPRPPSDQPVASAPPNPATEPTPTPSLAEKMLAEVREFSTTGKRPVWYSYLAMIIDATPSRKGIAEGLGMSSSEVNSLLAAIVEVHGIKPEWADIRRILGRAAT